MNWTQFYVTLALVAWATVATVWLGFTRSMLSAARRDQKYWETKSGIKRDDFNRCSNELRVLSDRMARAKRILDGREETP